MRLARGLVAVMLAAFAFAAFADTYPSAARQDRRAVFGRRSG